MCKWDVELSVNITNDEGMSNAYLYTWVIDGEVIAEDESGIFIHGPDLNNGPVEVIVTDLASMCSSQTTVMVDYYMNQNCVDIPQGISPNGDGLNDCLVLDHLEAQEDIVKAEIYNRYGIKVFEQMTMLITGVVRMLAMEIFHRINCCLSEHIFMLFNMLLIVNQLLAGYILITKQPK